MTLTLELSPGTEAALSEKARRLGVSVADYLVKLAEREAQMPDSLPGDAPGHLTGFLAQAEALTQRLKAAGFEGVNAADMVRAGREERAERLCL